MTFVFDCYVKFERVYSLNRLKICLSRKEVCLTWNCLINAIITYSSLKVKVIYITQLKIVTFDWRVLIAKCINSSLKFESSYITSFEFVAIWLILPVLPVELFEKFWLQNASTPVWSFKVWVIFHNLKLSPLDWYTLPNLLIEKIEKLLFYVTLRLKVWVIHHNLRLSSPNWYATKFTHWTDWRVLIAKCINSSLKVCVCTLLRYQLLVIRTQIDPLIELFKWLKILN